MSLIRFFGKKTDSENSEKESAIKKEILKETFIEGMIKKSIALNTSSRKILLFAENDATILKACSIILEKGIAMPMIVGNKNELTVTLKANNIANIKDEHIIDYLDQKYASRMDDYSKEFMEMRIADGKTITIEEANKLMKLPHYYAAMMIKKGSADAMICGINSETKPYLPAFQIIKTRKDVTKASGLFILQKEDSVFFYADCALNINPTSEELAMIAKTTADSVAQFGQNPRIAMISFSTKDSAKHEMVDKVKNATKIVKEKYPQLILDGELQIDAAIVPSVAAKKCPDSVLKGAANTLIFSDLNAGNSAYKITQRMGGYKALGPIMQGLNKPVNDLSRGASVDDVVELAAVTILQTVN